jgi:leucyl/phenylalanyl-tRNA--protein transferase
MPIYRLIDELVFPPPEQAEPDGLLAVGGDLSAKRLILAYQLGIFPWFEEGQPILWWSPDPRLVLEPEEFHVSKRLAQTIKNGKIKVTFDRAFASVIRSCATVPRKGESGTWITPEMQEAYIHLHQLGVAHSVESWLGEELVGGVYGVSLGKCFFGESMFSTKPNASKIALAVLVRRLKDWGFHVIDAQVTSQHLLSLGAKEIPRKLFLERLKGAVCLPTIRGPWNSEKSQIDEA